MTIHQLTWPVLLFLWAAVIMVVSVIPGADLPSLSIWEPDKVMHVFVYAVLTFLFFKWLKGFSTPVSLNKKAFIAVTVCILYGFIIELIQLILPTRSFDLLDELANMIGCLLSLIGILVFSSKRNI